MSRASVGFVQGTGPAAEQQSVALAEGGPPLLIPNVGCHEYLGDVAEHAWPFGAITTLPEAASWPRPGQGLCWNNAGGRRALVFLP